MYDKNQRLYVKRHDVIEVDTKTYPVERNIHTIEKFIPLKNH